MGESQKQLHSKKAAIYCTGEKGVPKVLFSYRIFYKDVKNPIFFYVVVNSIVRIIESHWAIVLASKLKTIIHPLAGQAVMLTKKRCFV